MWCDGSDRQIFSISFPAAWLASRLGPLHMKAIARQLSYAMTLDALTWQWAKSKIASHVEAPWEERKSGSKTQVIKMKKRKKKRRDVKVFVNIVASRWAKGEDSGGQWRTVEDGGVCEKQRVTATSAARRKARQKVDNVKFERQQNKTQTSRRSGKLWRRRVPLQEQLSSVAHSEAICTSVVLFYHPAIN